MNYIGFSEFDMANGEGVRVSLFVSGCTIHCKGCFNPESWDFKAGKPFDKKMAEKVIEALAHPYVRGLSILGGDPFEAENKGEVLNLVKLVRSRYGDSKDIWIWTGRKIEKLKEDSISSEILKKIDILVDGAFVEKLKVKEAGKWFGSSNQRVIKISNNRNFNYN